MSELLERFAFTGTKVVTGVEGDRKREQYFRVELSDKIVNGRYGEMTFKNGVAEFTLKSGETKTATGIPSWITCKVTQKEADQDEYFTTSVGEIGTILETVIAHVRFKNWKPDNPQPPEKSQTTQQQSDSHHSSSPVSGERRHHLFQITPFSFEPVLIKPEISKSPRFPKKGRGFYA